MRDRGTTSGQRRGDAHREQPAATGGGRGGGGGGGSSAPGARDDGGPEAPAPLDEAYVGGYDHVNFLGDDSGDSGDDGDDAVRYQPRGGRYNAPSANGRRGTVGQVLTAQVTPTYTLEEMVRGQPIAPRSHCGTLRARWWFSPVHEPHHHTTRAAQGPHTTH